MANGYNQTTKYICVKFYDESITLFSIIKIYRKEKNINQECLSIVVCYKGWKQNEILKVVQDLLSLLRDLTK